MSQEYAVCQILTIVTLPDFEMPQPRYHHEIFVLINLTTGSGISHYVTGGLIWGMYYESKPVLSLEESETFPSKEYPGTVQSFDYPHEVDGVLKAQALPLKQKSLNVQRMKTEQVKGDGPFYEEWEERPRIRKCTEWTREQAIPALYADGVLRK